MNDNIYHCIISFFVLKLGPCAGWRNKCDDKNVDTCHNGDCYCGEARGPACTGNTNTCSGGVCKCGTKDACTAKSVDTCTTDTKYGFDFCGCGGGAECSGQSDTCTDGKINYFYKFSNNCQIYVTVYFEI